MSDTALRLHGVSKRFYLSDNLRRESAWSTTYRLLTGESEHRPIWAVKEVSLELPKGEILGVIGPNGAGKSTLLLLVAQILEPTEGLVEVNGKTSSFFQLAAGLSPKLSVLESFELTGALLGMHPARFRKLLPQIIEFSGLEEFLYAKYGELSSGMAARVAFSTAVHSDLDIILIDEGLSVGDESFQTRCREKIYGLLKEGKTSVIVSHELDKIAAISNRILYLNRGYPVFLGEPTEAVERMRRDFGLTTEIDQGRKQAYGFVSQMPKRLEALRQEISGDVASIVRSEIERLKASVIGELELPLRHHMDDIRKKLSVLESAPHEESQRLKKELKEYLDLLISKTESGSSSYNLLQEHLNAQFREIGKELGVLHTYLGRIDLSIKHQSKSYPELYLRQSFSETLKGVPVSSIFLCSKTDAPATLDTLLRKMLQSSSGEPFYVAPEGYENPMLKAGGWKAVGIAADAESFGLSPAGLAGLLSSKGPKPAFVVCPHVNATGSRMDEISALCKANGLLLVEDLYGNMGGAIKGVRLGAFDSLAVLDCTYPDASVHLKDMVVFIMAALSQETFAFVENHFHRLGYRISCEELDTAKRLLGRLDILAQSRSKIYVEYEEFFKKWGDRYDVQRAPHGVLAVPESFCFRPKGGKHPDSAALSVRLLELASKKLSPAEFELLERRLLFYGRAILSVPLDCDSSAMLDVLRETL